MSRLFTPYRTIGVVADGMQQAVSTLGSATFLVTSIGRAFAVWRTDHLTLALVSSQSAHPITHVAAARDVTFTASASASGAGVTVWRRGQPVRALVCPPEAGSPTPGRLMSLLILGDSLVVVYESGVVAVWDHRAASSGGADASLLLMLTSLSSAVGAPTCVLHPDTYINKVAVGTSRGVVALLNVRTGELVHECYVLRGSGSNGDVAVSALAQSSVVDVLAVGGRDGRVVLYNLREDTPVSAFSHAGEHCPAVTSLAFSFGGALPLLASATEGGAVAVWNLESRTLASQLPMAHEGAVTLAVFLPGAQQSLLTAGGGDNAVRVWAVERLDGGLSLLRSRAGHIAPPRLVRYYAGASVATIASGADAAACEVASAGADRALRCFHTALDRQNCELSQGHLVARARAAGGVPAAHLRLPPVIALAASDRRRGQWADVITAHAGSSRAFCWSWDAKRLEERALAMPDSSEAVVSLCISACGNFALAGGAGGTIARFNLQSGARRGVYPPDAAAKSVMAAKGPKRRGLHPEGDAYLGAIDRDTGRGRGCSNGLHAVDSVDTALLLAAGVAPPPAVQGRFRAAAFGGLEGDVVAAAAAGGEAPAALLLRHTSAVSGVASDALNAFVVSTDSNGGVIWWDFETHAALQRLALSSPATALVLQRESGLAALPCDDFCVRVIDTATRRCVRSFAGHTNRITDVAFSADCRWLLSASLDGSVRVWDLPTGRCIDWLAFEQPPTSIALSPTGEYLVTAHADSLGLSLWANKAHFGAVVLEACAPSPVRMDMPLVARGEGEGGGSYEDEGGDAALAVTGAAPVRTETQRPGEPSVGSKRARPLSDDAAALPEGDAEPKLGCAITLSGLPTASWATLLKLDVIAARNKPVAPPTKPEAAPFFLPTSGGLHPVFQPPPVSDAPSATTGAQLGEGSGARVVLARGGRMARSLLAGLLRSGTAPDGIAAHLASLAPASVDVELRSLCLGPDDADGVGLLTALLRHFEARLISGAPDWELLQAHLALTLRVHQDVLPAHAVTRDALERVAEAQSPSAAHLRALLDRGLSMVSHFLGI